MATQAAGTAGNVVATARGFAELPNRSKFGLILGLSALVAIAMAALMWVRTPEYRVLFSNLSDRDGGAIVAALSQMNVPYRFAEGGGAILVPATHVHDARLRLASQGLPKGGNVGFELLETQRFGITQFQEQVNYQRALEGELARSIQALSAVQSARVHLAMPKQSAFLRETQKPTASVLLALFPGKTLERAQVAGIAHLVASSVPELSIKSVSVVDQSGVLLSAQGSDGDARLDPSQLAYVQTVEASYVKRIAELLEPIVGRANFRAQVTADIDFTMIESTDETFKPNRNQTAASVRSEQWNESSSASGANGAQGVPGALSNQPPAPSSAPITQTATPPQAPGTPGTGDSAVKNPTAAQRSTAVNYEIDKTIRHTRAQVGAVKRLSTAVVVNYRKPAQADGKPQPLSDQEIQQIEALVREAVGFKQDRGDSLRVSAAPFSVEAIAPGVEVPFWKRPEVIAYAIEAAKWLLGAILFLLVLFGVLRPTLRQLATPGPAPRVAPGPQGGNPEGAAEDTVVSLRGGQAGAPRLENAGAKLDQARQLARQDPRVVANVVRNWVNGNG
jgi:flagellar M-ring protein FliF